MNTAHLLVGEAIVAIGINCWQQMKQGYVPFPGTVMLSAVSFSILGVFAYVDENLAGLLGAGFLLALIVKQYQNGWDSFQGTVPQESGFFFLRIGTAGATADSSQDQGDN